MSGAVPTRVARTPDGRGWTLLRGGEPYFIRGMGGTSRCARAAELGANSVRTWSATDLGAALDDAHAAGLTVCAGLWVRHASLGPDWYDSMAHAAEREAKLREIREAVRAHRNHPALLVWAVGNEPNAGGFNAHAPLWRFVNAVARLVKEEDPHHAVATVTTSPTEELVASLNAHCPDVDVWGVNVYGSVATRIAAKMKELRWSRAYAVTEYGPMNWWQVKSTAWGAPLEPSSTEKAASYAAALAALSGDATCVGGVAFKWGWKEQVTVTWVCLVNEYAPTLRANGGPLVGGEEVGAVEELARVWRGAYPAHRAPQLRALTLAGSHAADSVRLPAGAAAPARCDARHPSGAAVSFLWLVLPEGGKLGERARTEGQSWKGGVPQPMPGCVAAQDDKAGAAAIIAPRSPGFYRLYVWVYDAHNKIATANVPFEVVAAPGGAAAAAPMPAAPVPVAPPAPTRRGEAVTLPCAADGYVRDGKHSKTCYASEDALVTKCPETPGAGYGRTAYLRFDLPAGCAPPARALLRVQAVSGDGGGRVVADVHAVADATWEEAALCADTAPQYAPTPLASSRVAGYGCFIAFDVTQHVAAAAAAGARRVAFALLNAGPSEKTNTWHSRRAGADTAPQLELTH